MTKGDIVLITFPFTNLMGSKVRPALVLAETKYDVTVIFITSQFKLLEPTDVVIEPTDNNGIKVKSLLKTAKFATLDKTLIFGRLGRVDTQILEEINDKIRIYLNL